MTTIFTAILIALAGLGLFSQFGRRLSAKHSLVWIAVFLFLIIAAATPHWLEPIAHIFGFKLVSNFVLAGLIFFSFLEILQQSAQNVKVSRKLREIICANAAERFVEKVGIREADQESGKQTTVLIVSPCFNEQESLPATLDSLSVVKFENPNIDFCIVNDGSRDSTLAILKTRAPKNYTSHLSNAGVGAALLTGFLAARELGADFVVQCDADGQHPFADIPRLVEEARQYDIDLLIGSRFATRKRNVENLIEPGRPRFSAPPLDSTSLTRWLGGRIISLTLGLFGRQALIKDPTSGFRVYSRKAFTYLIEHMPEEYPEPESIALLLQAEMKVEETLVTMQPRAGGVSSLSGFKSAQFMLKVFTALVALRIRNAAQR